MGRNPSLVCGCTECYSAEHTALWVFDTMPVYRPFANNLHLESIPSFVLENIVSFTFPLSHTLFLPLKMLAKRVVIIYTFRYLFYCRWLHKYRILHILIDPRFINCLERC